MLGALSDGSTGIPGWSVLYCFVIDSTSDVTEVVGFLDAVDNCPLIANPLQ